jgi:hypothetical protein
MTTWPKYAPTPRSTAFPYKKLSYLEQVATYNARKEALALRMASGNHVSITTSNSGTQDWSAITMYMERIAAYQRSVDFAQKMLQADLLFVMPQSVEFVDMATYTYAQLISDNQRAQACWRQAFAIDFPDECADIYRC